jgi:hypothetical protein
VIPLDHGWQIATDPSGQATLGEMNSHQWRGVRVGLSWNAQFGDLHDYMGVAWYRTTMDIPASNSPRRTIVRFGAVDYAAEVFVNGKSVGMHEGGYTPFAIDISDAVYTGRNELAVKVLDVPMTGKDPRYSAMPYDEIPHGKQNWYVQTGGIWQPVQLEFRPKTYIEKVHVTAQVGGDLTITAHVGGGNPAEVSYTVRDRAGRTVAQGSGISAAGVATLKSHVDEPKLWSPDVPALYTVEVNLNHDEDVRQERFGFRSFEAREGKLYLNGQPFYMRAALDQDFYPETIYTPPSKQYVREEMEQAKRMGLNVVRCHIKVCDPTYLEAADETGMLVWYEIPSWNDGHAFTTRAAERGERTFAEMVERDWNHPSIVIQSIINESWGADLNQADQRAWLGGAYDRAKKLTQPLGRLIDDNSACCKNFHVKSDLDDFHQYFSIPDNAGKWSQWTADFASRPTWSFSPHGDATRTGKEPLIVSEFGNWGLPKLPKDLPWWFDRGFGNREVTRPAGVLERFQQYGFSRLYPTFNDLAEATQWHQFDSLKYEIEDMRQHGSVQGYVITELTDINWEVNGLMDMWRNPKVYAGRLAQIQRPDVILARMSKRNYVAGDSIPLDIVVSHYRTTDWTGARIRWNTQSGAAGEFGLDKAPVLGTVEAERKITLVAPVTNVARREWIALQVVSASGAVLCDNIYDIFVYPKPTTRTTLKIGIHDPSKGLAGLSNALVRSGYTMSSAEPSKGELLIASVFDAMVDRYVRNGGRAVLLLNGVDALPKGSSIAIRARKGSELDGNWVTNFNWARTDLPTFRDVAFGKILGFEAAAATPRYVLSNIAAKNYEDVLAGIFYGWLNDNVAIAVQARHGRGALLATTLQFADYGTDPYARNLLNGMISYASGSEFHPKLEWSGVTANK